jgi:ribonuclease HI
MIRLFTDGACKANGKKGAQASYAGFFPEHPDWSFAQRVDETESQTNQRGELKAIYEGVKIALEKSGAPAEYVLEIYTDSTYSRDCLTTWLPGWLRNNWMTTAGKPVLHRDLIEGTSRILPQFKGFSIVYVKAHTGKKDELSRYNDVVDKMAVGVLVPKEVKEISTTDEIFEGLPLKMMGGPIEESVINQWCLDNIDKLDSAAVKSALFSAFKKTVQKNGYDLDIQVINKTRVVRLVSTSLVRDGVTIIKE